MIEVIKVVDRVSGNDRAHEILKGLVDSQTLLVLSGGTSPDYRRMIVEPGDAIPGAVCLGDERFGMPFHDDSNELLIKNAGLIDFFQVRDIKFYKILSGADLQTTAREYNQTVLSLFAQFPKMIGVMGVGPNLHTAGIFPQSNAVKSSDLVVAETVEDRFPNRITLTIRALEQFSFFIILMFGIEKEEAVKKMVDENINDIQNSPAIFYRKSPIKSYLITDQEIDLTTDN